ncbi:Nop53 60S ribosomal biogenesis protein [Helicosporidium sp. ATCC 50920]|nr:Nop53 60S ribosomal biogenesis protein [Helicosporidium sp. ATCC 50920]|eukprot:KDD75752.1 Nop53 60S ribosomal biogenesis protein [Helicosporidium sp. ATCC 50920]
MGKQKKRKQDKKAWRGIDVSEVNDALEEQTRRQRQNLDFERIPDADLFFVDTAPEDVDAPPPRPLTTKEKYRALTLRSDALLAESRRATPVTAAAPASQLRKPKPSRTKTPASAARTQKQRRTQVAAAHLARDAVASKALVVHAAGASAGSEDLWAPAADVPKILDFDQEARRLSNLVPKRALLPSKRGRARALPPSVELPLPGASFNPEPAQHQAALREAVAEEERKKQAASRLARRVPSLLTDAPSDAGPASELESLLTLDVDAGEAEEEEEEEEADAGYVKAPQPAKKTAFRRKLEARKRAKAYLRAIEVRKARQGRQLDRLDSYVEEVEAVLEGRALSRAVKEARRLARLERQPPRLGAGRFASMPLQVLTSDELSGSLRCIKPTTMLIRDRYKSVQRRGMLEPPEAEKKKIRLKTKTYIHANRNDATIEGHQEIQEARERIRKRRAQEKMESGEKADAAARWTAW